MPSSCRQNASKEGQKMDFKNRKYRYLITGFTNGQPIKPYTILATISELEKHLYTEGDNVRYYEELL
jgi:hypothetical protein